MAPLLVRARGRAEQRHGLARGDALGKRADAEDLAAHLHEVARHVLVERERRSRLAVVRGVQRLARPELRPPLVPGLVGLGDAKAVDEAASGTAFALM